MKVLMLGNDPTVKGGITSVISQLLAHNWNADGIEMKFIPTYVETNSVKKIFFFAKALTRIEKEFRTNKPDVVHMHMSYKGSFTRKYLLHRLCKKYNIPDIIHLHGSEFKKWYDEVDEKKKREIRTLLRESKAFIVLGEKWNKTIKEIEPTTKIVVVSNTVYIPDYTVGWKQPFTILFMGVLIKRKGVTDLIKAIDILKKENKLDNIRLKIAGSGEEEAGLKALCAQLGLDSYIDFTGWAAGETKEKLLRESQMLVLPSYNEGLPIAILEAISRGMPVVASDVGDISSAIKDGENGYLIKPGDVKDLATSIEKICTNRDTYSYMNKMSRELATNSFSDSSYFKMIRKLYDNVCYMK